MGESSTDDQHNALGLPTPAHTFPFLLFFPQLCCTARACAVVEFGSLSFISDSARYKTPNWSVGSDRASSSAQRVPTVCCPFSQRRFGVLEMFIERENLSADWVFNDCGMVLHSVILNGIK